MLTYLDTLHYVSLIYVIEETTATLIMNYAKYTEYKTRNCVKQVLESLLSVFNRYSPTPLDFN